MAQLPDGLKLWPAQQAVLDAIRADATQRHEAARKAARRQGRIDFPLLPYECVWAYEEEYRRNNH